MYEKNKLAVVISVIAIIVFLYLLFIEITNQTTLSEKMFAFIFVASVLALSTLVLLVNINKILGKANNPSLLTDALTRISILRTSESTKLDYYDASIEQKTYNSSKFINSIVIIIGIFSLSLIAIAFYLFFTNT